jgi:hypothetical protein
MQSHITSTGLTDGCLGESPAINVRGEVGKEQKARSVLCQHFLLIATTRAKCQTVNVVSPRMNQNVPKFMSDGKPGEREFD